VEQKQEKGKSRKKLYLLGALALVLALTSSMFAYTYTTASATITATGDSDYAAVSANSTLPSFAINVFGKHRGDVPTGDLFNITPDSDYTGDLLVKVYLTNADELTKTYQHLNMKLQLRGASDNNIGTAGHTFQLLSLDNGVATFDMNRYTGTWDIYLAGGSYTTNPRHPLDWGSGSQVEPLLYCEVTQR